MGFGVWVGNAGVVGKRSSEKGLVTLIAIVDVLEG